VIPGYGEPQDNPQQFADQDGVLPDAAVVQLFPEGQRTTNEPTAGLADFLLPSEVWDGSPVMKHIHAAAMARITCPDAVLHGALAIIASKLYYASRVDTGKRPSVLNYFYAPIGPSGGGKTESFATARELLDGWADERAAQHETGMFIDAPLGTGEGLIEAFMGNKEVPKLAENGKPLTDGLGRPEMKTERAQIRHNALFVADEGRQVLAIDSRKGATVLSTLCELWSGSVVGQTNAEAARTRKLEAGTYAVGIILGFQLSTIDGLFDDEAGGAPQRFAYSPAVYPAHADNIDQDPPPWPGGLHLDIPDEPVTVTLGDTQRREVVRHLRLKAAGMVDEGPLDGHRMLLKCRTAALLALLHGETTVSDDMWWLADQVVGKSCELRDWLADGRKRREEAVRVAKQRFQVETAAKTARVVGAQEDLKRAAAQIVRAVERNGGTEKRGKALNGIRSDIRHLKDRALELALSDGRLVELGDGWTLGLANQEGS
jgi:hypothetical protein